VRPACGSRADHGHDDLRGKGGFASVGSTGVDEARRQVDQCLDAGAAALSLTADELARLEQISRPPLLYPYWHQAKTAADRLGPADLSLLGPHLDG
jgi:hypothetical protein